MRRGAAARSSCQQLFQQSELRQKRKNLTRLQNVVKFSQRKIPTGTIVAPSRARRDRGLFFSVFCAGGDFLERMLGGVAGSEKMLELVQGAPGPWGPWSKEPLVDDPSPQPRAGPKKPKIYEEEAGRFSRETMEKFLAQHEDSYRRDEGTARGVIDPQELAAMKLIARQILKLEGALR